MQIETSEASAAVTEAAHEKLNQEILAKIMVKNPQDSLADKIEKYWDGTMIVTDTVINQIFRGYVEGMNAIKNKKHVENLINKLDTWSDNLEGNNYEAREKVFANGFMKIAEKEGVKELDLLAFR